MVASRNARKRPVLKPRNGGKWTEAQFWSWLRSQLRRSSMRWAPLYKALERVKRPNQSANKRLKWEFQCEECRDWFPRKGVEVDHEPPVGSLLSYDDLPRFVERLFCESDGLRVLCKVNCHAAKTAVAPRQSRRTAT